MKEKLKKQLGTLEVFSIASGAMISSGLFILPSVIYKEAGPSIIISYILAAIIIVPAMLSKIELATAMPKSGGAYFFVNKSFGPLFGTLSGFSSWFALSLKSAFALIGIGIFLNPFIPELAAYVKIIGITFTVFFTVINIISVKHSGRFQVVLLLALLGILFLFIILGISSTKFDINNFVPFTPNGWVQVLPVTGMIFISFSGLTKIAAVAEEIKNPGKTIPKGMLSAFFVVSLTYLFVIFVTVGLLNENKFESLTPLSEAAKHLFGEPGFNILIVAGMLAFITTANAGLMAASRSPLAMAKDNLLPSIFSKVSIRFRTPVVSIIVTSLFMICAIIFFDIKNLVKIASTMGLILFSLVNISVVLMRESRILSYKPTFKSPLYPYIHIAGTVIYIYLIFQMGLEYIIMTVAFFTITLLLYLLFSKSRNKKDSAIIRIVERLTSKEIKTPTLNNELRDILLERDEIIEDRFDSIIKAAKIIDIENEINIDELFQIVADILTSKYDLKPKNIINLLQEREKDSTTAIYPGLAIPHIVIPGKNIFDIVVVRSKHGISFSKDLPLVNIIFALAGSKDERTFHLQALMAIAQIVQNKDFEHNWMKTRNAEDLRNLILLAQRIRKGTI